MIPLSSHSAGLDIIIWILNDVDHFIHSPELSDKYHSLLLRQVETRRDTASRAQPKAFAYYYVVVLILNIKHFFTSSTIIQTSLLPIQHG